MLHDEDIQQFSKQTALFVTLIEDDSSGTEDPDKPGTIVKILHLAESVNATGSIPTRGGQEMKVKHNKVYVAADDWALFKKTATKGENGITYKGEMHLDVSKPKTRTGRDGKIEITSTSKIWLTAIKFSKRKGKLIGDATENLNGFMNKLFESGNVLDLSAPVDTNTAAGIAVDAEPEVVVAEKEPVTAGGGRKGK
jgi:hypothetical protein